MIAVVDSGVANLTSVMAALQRTGAQAEVTSDAEAIRKADHVILPGVGAAAPAMAKLREKNLVELLCNLTQPVLGICLGMQLLFTRSFEGKDQQVQCLNIISGDVIALPAKPETPVPHMGWNEIEPVVSDHPLLKEIKKGDYVYFVHGFAVVPGGHTLTTTDYGMPFSSISGKKNFFGCQFHPERSGAIGSRILKNFIAM